MCIRLPLLVSALLASFPGAAFSQSSQGSTADKQQSPQIRVVAVLIRVEGTTAEVKDIRSNLAQLISLKGWDEFAASVDGLRSRNQVTILGEPHLVMLSGHPCSYLSGGQDEEGVAIGLKADATATVMADGRIWLKLAASLTELSGDPVKAPDGRLIQGRKTDAFQTSMMLEDGQAFAMPGGSSSHEVREARTGPPILKGIPVLRDIFCPRQTFGVEVETICFGRVLIAKDK